MSTPFQPCGRIMMLGGSSAIGLAIVEQICAPQAVICLVGRPSARQSANAELLRSQGHTVSEVTYDASMTLTETEEVLGRAWRILDGGTQAVDAVVMAIGTMGAPETPEATLTTNLVGPALLLRTAQGLLVSQGAGTLIVLSSAAALRPREEILEYSLAKQGVDSMIRATAGTLKARGVRTLLVRPGFVSTPMTAHLSPPPLSSTTASTARQVVRALRRGRSVVWVPGAMRWVVLALRILPRRVLPANIR